MTTLNTEFLHSTIARLRAGDREAYNELHRRSEARLRRLIGHELSKFPGVQRRIELDDLVQEVCIQVLRALKTFTPHDTKRYFQLVGQQARWRLLRLAQQCNDGEIPPSRLGVPQEEWGELDLGGIVTEKPEAWVLLVEGIERLPLEVQAAAHLRWLTDLTVAEIAEFLALPEKTIKEYVHQAQRLILESLSE